jgi:hypothetical protein
MCEIRIEYWNIEYLIFQYSIFGFTFHLLALVGSWNLDFTTYTYGTGSIAETKIVSNVWLWITWILG